jgi:hypothetical protein
MCARHARRIVGLQADGLRADLEITLPPFNAV